ncbi:MAG: sodium:solute symporter family protein [Rickettsiaceae bacterium H1]|nr:sodium:solute symporter family protein [Rickettsiaceae bacterium H1]
MIIVLIAVISLLVFYVAMISTKSTSDSESYYLYDNRLGTVLLTLTIIATQVGGGMVVGIADESYKAGFAGLFYPLGTLFGLLIIAFIFGDLLKNVGLSTVSGIFEKKYRFPLARKFSSIISSVSLFVIMVAQGVAIKHLLTGIGFDSGLVFIIIWCGVILYTSLGGIKAVVATNVLQITLISIALFTLLFFALNHSNLNSINFSSKINYYSAIEWFIWPCCYMLIEQDMAQLFFSAKSKETVKRAAIIASVGILILAAIPTFIGILASNHVLLSNKGVLLFFAKNYLSGSIYAVTLVAIILAITSTIDSLLCAISSNIAYDFSISKLNGKYLRLLTSIIGIVSLIAVFYCESIISILMFSYSFCVSALFVPLIFGLLLPEAKLKKSSVVFSSFFGIVSLIVLSFVKSGFTYLSIPFSAIGYFLPVVFKSSLKFEKWL